MKKTLHLLKRWRPVVLLAGLLATTATAFASSHREAPLIAQDPQADNTDVYAFRSPDDTNFVTIIANYIPFQLPEGGPNYYTFSPNVRYEIHIKNSSTTTGDDITYRFTFQIANEDTTTFFNIRLGKQNQKTTYIVEKSLAGGPFTTVLSGGVVPPYNIGPRSISGAAGLNQPSYGTLMQNSIAFATGSTALYERYYAGPADDPFFVDLAGAFDLGNFRPNNNTTNPTKDGLARYNVHSICLRLPISSLQAQGKLTSQASSILDPSFVIGVWASASRQQIKTLNANGTSTSSGNWVQISRLGMPLTNEVVIPVGMKDKWNATTPGSAADAAFFPFFKNPELALYMDNSQFGAAVPALTALRIQSKSLGQFDFRNGKKGLYLLKGSPALVGTAFDPATFGNILLPDSVSPRAADILPIFMTGVPNLAPYQLATGKAAGNPLSPGKPFINNFLPTLSDMLRLNMAVPVTPRSSADFSSLGIIQAAALGLTDARFNTSTALQFIPNMDGFPNGRRLEDDVTTIELQAVSGIALAAVGLWYDDYIPGTTASPVTPQLLRVLTFTAGPTANDTTFQAVFPYVQQPWRGADYTFQQRF